jgi:hypothetical protein
MQWYDCGKITPAADKGPVCWQFNNWTHFKNYTQMQSIIDIPEPPKADNLPHRADNSASKADNSPPKVVIQTSKTDNSPFKTDIQTTKVVTPTSKIVPTHTHIKPGVDMAAPLVARGNTVQSIKIRRQTAVKGSPSHRLFAVKTAPKSITSIRNKSLAARPKSKKSCPRKRAWTQDEISVIKKYTSNFTHSISHEMRKRLSKGELKGRTTRAIKSQAHRYMKGVN